MKDKSKKINQITFISGKGGTGKTTFALGFAHMFDKVILVDGDVDASNLHLSLDFKTYHQEDFYSGKLAVISQENCNQCKKCVSICHFRGIEVENQAIVINPYSCEGCGLCEWVCDQNAISRESRNNGKWFLSEIPWGYLVHSRLNPGGENSGKLVQEVRKQGRSIALAKDISWIVIDGPPGIGCPVIASITGVNYVVIVTEPTCSGIKDLKRIINLVEKFKLNGGVCVNQWDINPGNTNIINSIVDKTCLDWLGGVSYYPDAREFQKDKKIRKNNHLYKEIRRIGEKICLNLKT